MLDALHEYIEGTKKVGIAFQHNFMKDVMNNGFSGGQGSRLCYTNQDNITFFMQSRTLGYQVEIPSQAKVMQQIDLGVGGLDAIFIPDGVEDDILDLAQEFKEHSANVPIVLLSSSAHNMLQVLETKPSETLERLIAYHLVSVDIRPDHTISLSETRHINNYSNPEDIRSDIRAVLEAKEQLILPESIDSVLAVSSFEDYRRVIKGYLGLPAEERQTQSLASPHDVIDVYPELYDIEEYAYSALRQNIPPSLG